MRFGRHLDSRGNRRGVCGHPLDESLRCRVASCFASDEGLQRARAEISNLEIARARDCARRAQRAIAAAHQELAKKLIGADEPSPMRNVRYEVPPPDPGFAFQSADPARNAARGLLEYLVNTNDFGSRECPSFVIKDFQRAMRDLRADGIVGADTRRRARILGVVLPAKAAFESDDIVVNRNVLVARSMHDENKIHFLLAQNFVVPPGKTVVIKMYPDRPFTPLNLLIQPVAVFAVLGIEHPTLLGSDSCMISTMDEVTVRIANTTKASQILFASLTGKPA